MRRTRVALAGALLIAGCGGAPEPEAGAPRLPWAREAMPEVPLPSGAVQTPEAVELGRLLFYDPVLSGDGTLSCATCHSEYWGLGDGLTLAIGKGGSDLAGPGRQGPALRRNSITLWNAAYAEHLFWDGRAASLEDQIRFPLESAEELDLAPSAAAARVAAVPEYAARFGGVFAEGVSVRTLEGALAAFVRSLTTTRSAYDRYVAGDEGTLDAGAKDGLFAFARAGCAGCHVPPRFDADRYFARGVGQGADPGRFDVTGDEADRGAFRVPTLRNVVNTGPYFHDGSVETLAAAVDHEADQADVSVGSADRAAITRFLQKALLDESQSPARPAAVPSGLTMPRDGFRIVR